MPSYAITKEQLPFSNQEEKRGGNEFSKGLTRSMLEANRLRSRAYVEFFLRDVPRAMHNQLAEKFNRAVRSYNINRHKIIDTIHFGYNPDIKLFTIEEQFKTALAMFQSIEAILHKYPHKKYEEPKTNVSVTKEEESPADKLKRRLWAVGASATALTLLAACTKPAIAQVSTITEEAADPTKDLVSSTEDGQEIDLKTATAEASSTVAPTATVEPSPTATEKVMTLEEKVDAFAAGKIEFPENLTHEQYIAFIEKMNEKYANKPIYVEAMDKNNQPTILYHDIKTNKMVGVPGTYEENKDLLEQNGFATYVEIYKDEKTGNLQYVNPDTGELVTVPNSAGIDWTKIIDKNNMHDGYIDLPTITSEIGDETIIEEFLNGFEEITTKDMVLAQAILLSDNGITLTMSQGKYFDYKCLNMILIETNESGEPIYGKRVFVGRAGLTTLLAEGSSKSTNLPYQTGKYKGILNPGSIYFVLLTKNQTSVWNNTLLTSMNMKNVNSTDDAYDSVINDKVTDKNTVLTTRFIIEKK